MGYDVSYHPVDERLIRDEVIPFILGEQSLDDRFRDAARIAETRYRANARGLAVSRLHSGRRRSERAPKPSLLKRLLGRASDGAGPDVPAFHFDPDLFVWGRPFFITQGSPAEVSHAIDRYLACNDGDVGTIAREMVDLLAPNLSCLLQPDDETTVPSHVQFQEAESQRLVLFAEAMTALRKETSLTLPDGQEVEPAELFASDFPLAAVSFAATFRPGWMARGHVWPTALLAQVDAPTEMFEPASALFQRLSEAEPRISFELEATIAENYTLGGYLPPAAVGEARELFAQNEERFLDTARADGWESECRIVVQKIQESLYDAETRGLGFLEASEVYSAPMGVMN